MLSYEQNHMLTSVGPGTAMGDLMRRYWVPAVLSSELPGPDSGPVRIRLLGEDLIAFRNTDGQVGVLGAQCPHRGAPLYFGLNEKNSLTCIYHGWSFDIEGACLSVPNAPPGRENDLCSRIRQTAYPCDEQSGIVWAYMGPTEEMPKSLPKLEFAALPEDRLFVTKQFVECNYAQALEGDLDPFHISYLHTSTSEFRKYKDLGGKKALKPLADPIDGVLSLEQEFEYALRDPQPAINVMPTPFGLFSAARRMGGEKTYYYRFNQFILPFYAGTPRSLGFSAQCNIWVPRDDTTTMVWRVNYDPDKPLTSEVRDRLLSGVDAHVPPDEYAEPTSVPQSEWYPKRNRSNDYGFDRAGQHGEGPLTGIAGIWAQDRLVTEGMGPIIDRTKERLVASDAPVVQTRQSLLDAASKLRESGVNPVPEDCYPQVTCIPAALYSRELEWEEIANSLLGEVSGNRDAASAGA